MKHVILCHEFGYVKEKQRYLLFAAEAVQEEDERQAADAAAEYGDGDASGAEPKQPSTDISAAAANTSSIMGDSIGGASYDGARRREQSEYGEQPLSALNDPQGAIPGDLYGRLEARRPEEREPKNSVMGDGRNSGPLSPALQADEEQVAMMREGLEMMREGREIMRTVRANARPVWLLLMPV